MIQIFFFRNWEIGLLSCHHCNTFSTFMNPNFVLDEYKAAKTTFKVILASGMIYESNESGTFRVN